MINSQIPKETLEWLASRPYKLVIFDGINDFTVRTTKERWLSWPWNPFRTQNYTPKAILLDDGNVGISSLTHNIVLDYIFNKETNKQRRTTNGI